MAKDKRNYTEEQKQRAQYIGAYLTSVMVDYVDPETGVRGITARALSERTGLAATTVNNLMNGVFLPGRETLRFMLDVLGVPADDDDRNKALGLAADRSVHSTYVRMAMRRFYGDRDVPAPKPTRTGVFSDDSWRPATTDEVIGSCTAHAADAVAVALRHRSVAVDEIVDRLVALVDVTWDDVIEWLRTHTATLDDASKAEIMRTLWETK